MNFDEKLNDEILFVSQTEPETLYDMDDLMNTISEKRSKTISIVDAEHPENSQLYTYNKFLEIFDDSGLNGFIL